MQALMPVRAVIFFRTMFLDRDWFTLETASTLIANYSGLLHAPVPVQAPAVPAEATVPAQQQQKGKQKQTKSQKQQEQSLPPPLSVPLSAVETAAAALSGMDFCKLRCDTIRRNLKGTITLKNIPFKMNIYVK